MKNVTIKFCHRKTCDWLPDSIETRHRTDNVETAIERAIENRWGKRAGFWIDNDISRPQEHVWYGQITKPCKSGGSTTITGLIRIDVA